MDWRNRLGLTHAQRRLLRELMLDDEPDGDCWSTFDPPFHVLTVRACEDKSLIEVSDRGLRLTDAGRDAAVVS